MTQCTEQGHLHLCGLQGAYGRRREHAELEEGKEKVW